MHEHSGTLLGILQHADTMFPTGAVSFSWGLEALCNRGLVTRRAELTEFAAAQLRGRWASLDRVMMVHAHRAEGDLDRIAALDALIEVQSLCAEQRLGSSRMGAAMLNTHRRLGSALTGAYADRVARGMAFGHIPVVQGLIWRGLGMDEAQIQAMAAHGICANLMGAAVRLSIIGHVDAQAIHADLRPLIVGILTSPVCAAEATYSFTPQIDIASMNHETDEMRLFVN